MNFKLGKQTFNIFATWRFFAKQSLPKLLVGVPLLLLTACTAPTPLVAQNPTVAPPTPTAVAAAPNTPTARLPTASPVPPTSTPTAVPTATTAPSPTFPIIPPTPTATATDTPVPTDTPAPPDMSAPPVPALVIDHRSVEKFSRIPDEYIQAAREIRWLHRGASVGVNIAAIINQNGTRASSGLNCLGWVNLGAPPDGGRPKSCGCPQIPLDNRWENICRNEAQSFPADAKYTRDNWVFEVHPYRIVTDNLQEIKSLNPGWRKKTNYFIQRVDTLAPDEKFDFVSFQMGYVEGPSINDEFFTNTDDVFRTDGSLNHDDPQPGVANLEALDAAHPEFQIIWFTLAQARQVDFDANGAPHVQVFNDRLREYTETHGKILFDLADIESHLPDGTPCFGIDAGGAPVDVMTVCDEYVNERVSGHLNAFGSNQVAQAIWVMMAQLAGWNGE